MLKKLVTSKSFFLKDDRIGLSPRFTFLGVFLRQGLACSTGWPLVDAPAWASPELGLWALTTVLLGGGLCETESEYRKDWMNPHRETFSSQLPCCSTHGSHSLIALDLNFFANISHSFSYPPS